MPTENNIDDVLESSRSGSALKVDKGRSPGAPVYLETPDPSRPAGTGINAKPTMAYAEAVAKLDDGTLARPVLTECGWVTLRRGIKSKAQGA